MKTYFNLLMSALLMQSISLSSYLVHSSYKNKKKIKNIMRKAGEE